MIVAEKDKVSARESLRHARSTSAHSQEQSSKFLRGKLPLLRIPDSLISQQH